LFCFLEKCIILASIGVLTTEIPNSYILQVRYVAYHIYLIRLIVLKRPGFQSQKYDMPATQGRPLDGWTDCSQSGPMPKGVLRYAY